MSDFKAPVTQEEWEALKKMLRSEISDADLEAVVGGNDDRPKPSSYVDWVCLGCGATIRLRYLSDLGKHMTKCPGNPFK